MEGIKDSKTNCWRLWQPLCSCSLHLQKQHQLCRPESTAQAAKQPNLRPISVQGPKWREKTRSVLDRFHDSSKVNAQCSMLCALCFLLFALCSVLCALCSVLCALCSVLCDKSLEYLIQCPKVWKSWESLSKNGFMLYAFGSPAEAQALFNIFLQLYKALLTIFLRLHFRPLFMALLTILCGGFLDDFVDNFLRLYLFCFICSPKFVHAVHKSVAFFRGVWGEGEV